MITWSAKTRRVEEENSIVWEKAERLLDALYQCRFTWVLLVRYYHSVIQGLFALNTINWFIMLIAKFSLEDINTHCLEQFREHWNCLERKNQSLWKCRRQETTLNKCVFDKIVRWYPSCDDQQGSELTMYIIGTWEDCSWHSRRPNAHPLTRPKSK